MEPEVAIQPPKTLARFCETVVASHDAEPWPPTEDAIARQFVSFFGIDGMLWMEALERLCQTLGVAVSHRDLPKPLRGHNCAYETKRVIVVGKGQGAAASFGVREHTLLHEMRELVEYEFRKLGNPVATSAPDLELRAESFAGLVRAWASFKTWEWYFERIGGIESRLLQFGAVLTVAVLAMVHHLSCVNLPRWEDQFPS